MDLALNEEQEMLRGMARDFLEKECPSTVVRAMEEDERGYPPELWQKIAELGWPGLIFPEEYGGVGLGLQELAVLYEEIGRALLPGPLFSSTVLCGLTLLTGASEAHKRQFLPRMAQR